MKRICLIAVAFILNACVVQTDVPVSSPELISEQVQKINEMVSILSSDEMGGRKFGSKGIEKAALFIEDHLVRAGIKPFFNQSFRDTLRVKEKETYNLVGVIEYPGVDDYVLIGAHYDHIGLKKSKRDSVFNGANDNASGVTAVLTIAMELIKHKLKKNVIIAFFTAEEIGLVGSMHLAKRLKKENVDIDYVINFDMIGSVASTGIKKAYLTGFEKSNLGNTINRKLGDNFVSDASENCEYPVFRLSDNYSFYLIYRIPAHTLITFDFTNYPYLHHVDDEIEALDIENMNAVISQTSQALIRLLSDNDRIVLKVE